MFTVTIGGKSANYDNRKQLHMLARAYGFISDALKAALHEIEGQDGTIEIAAIDLGEGLTIDAISATKIKDAQAQEAARQQAEMDEIHAQAEANAELAIKQAAITEYAQKLALVDVLVELGKATKEERDEYAQVNAPVFEEAAEAAKTK